MCEIYFCKLCEISASRINLYHINFYCARTQIKINYQEPRVLANLHEFVIYTIKMLLYDIQKEWGIHLSLILVGVGGLWPQDATLLWFCLDQWGFLVACNSLNIGHFHQARVLWGLWWSEKTSACHYRSMRGIIWQPQLRIGPGFVSYLKEVKTIGTAVLYYSQHIEFNIHGCKALYMGSDTSKG